MSEAPARTISQSIRDQRRDRIVQAAKAVFFETGYSAASMSMIAARLGGSKATLYAYFKSKEELFRAIVEDQCAEVQDAVESVDGDGDVRRRLMDLGLRLTTLLMSESTVRTLQLLAEEAARTPELARLFLEVGLERGEAVLTAFFAEAQHKGLLDLPDPASAAKQFVALVKGHLHFKLMLGLGQSVSEADKRRQVEDAVDMFLRAYGVKAGGSNAPGA